MSLLPFHFPWQRLQILEAYFFCVEPSPPAHPLVKYGMTEWYSEPSCITMLSLHLASVQRERERGARDGEEPLRQQHCSTPGKLTNHTRPTEPNTSAALSLCTFLLSFLSRPCHKMRGCLQTRQLHCGQQSSLFLQFQLPITDTTESISDIKVW